VWWRPQVFILIFLRRAPSMSPPYSVRSLHAGAAEQEPYTGCEALEHAFQVVVVVGSLLAAHGAGHGLGHQK
jgi:hypothetical protein